MIELTKTFKLLEAYDLTLVVVGLGVLALATLLHRFDKLPFSFPILALAFGYAAFALPLGLTPPDPQVQDSLAVHLTEIGVIVSLMGVGLKIDRFPHPRTWSTVWRMLGICMPLTIACAAALGWWMLGLAPAAAVLLAASLAPTDPVLAADVQVGEPVLDHPDDVEPPEGESSPERAPEEREDELRFTLTAEAGLNDALAFPFVYLALLMSIEGTAPADWIGHWLLIDVLYRIVVGAVAGMALGWGLSRALLRLPIDTEQERMKAGVGALAATLLLYGVTECVGGYGFLAVFVGAITIRHRERTGQAHRSLHTFAEQAEQLLMVGILIALGAAIAGGPARFPDVGGRAAGCVARVRRAPCRRFAQPARGATARRPRSHDRRVLRNSRNRLPVLPRLRVAEGRFCGSGAAVGHLCIHRRPIGDRPRRGGFAGDTVPRQARPRRVSAPCLFAAARRFSDTGTGTFYAAESIRHRTGELRMTVLAVAASGTCQHPPTSRALTRYRTRSVPTATTSGTRGSTG